MNLERGMQKPPSPLPMRRPCTGSLPRVWQQSPYLLLRFGPQRVFKIEGSYVAGWGVRPQQGQGALWVAPFMSFPSRMASLAVLTEHIQVSCCSCMYPFHALLCFGKSVSTNKSECVANETLTLQPRGELLIVRNTTFSVKST